MTPRKAPRAKSKDTPPNMDETKEHVLAAGREILLAAQGALRFCKAYVETTSESKSKPHLISFFQKAITVADELGKSIIDIAPIKHTARNVAQSIIDAMEEEMTSEESKVRRSSKESVSKKSRRKKQVRMKNQKAKSKMTYQKSKRSG